MTDPNTSLLSLATRIDDDGEIWPVYGRVAWKAPCDEGEGCYACRDCGEPLNWHHRNPSRVCAGCHRLLMDPEVAECDDPEGAAEARKIFLHSLDYVESLIVVLFGLRREHPERTTVLLDDLGRALREGGK